MPGDDDLGGDDLVAWQLCEGVDGNAGSSWEQLCIVAVLLLLADEVG